jgi:hypothetical protein
MAFPLIYSPSFPFIASVAGHCPCCLLIPSPARYRPPLAVVVGYGWRWLLALQLCVSGIARFGLVAPQAQIRSCLCTVQFVFMWW